MPSNLDRSLDEILATPPRTNRRASSNPPVTSGIRKRSQRAVPQKANAYGPSGKVCTSKIIVSNLPYDVSEHMIKEYFQLVAGPIRRAALTYGPDGRSRGVATIEFANPGRAARVALNYNGVEVDNRPMKVELVVPPNGPAYFLDLIGAPNEFSRPNRMKPIAVGKSAAKPAATSGRARSRVGKQGVRAGSGHINAKTAAELDEQMDEYFGSAVHPSSSGAPAPTSIAATGGGDVVMDDIL